MLNAIAHENRLKLTENNYISHTIHLKSMIFTCFLIKETTGSSGVIISYQRDSNNFRSSPSQVFFGKMVLKICSKFTGEHPCRGVISIELQSNFIEITLPHGCSPVNLLHISEHLWRAVSATLHLSLFNLQKLANRMKFSIILI